MPCMAAVSGLWEVHPTEVKSSTEVTRGGLQGVLMYEVPHDSAAGGLKKPQCR